MLWGSNELFLTKKHYVITWTNRNVRDASIWQHHSGCRRSLGAFLTLKARGLRNVIMMWEVKSKLYATLWPQLGDSQVLA